MYSENILILTYWPVDDALIQTYVLPYAKIIRVNLSANKKIWLQTFEREAADHRKSNLIRERLLKVGISWIRFQYSSFGLNAIFQGVINLVKLLLFVRTNRIGIIHVWCTPPGVTGYILSVLTGAKLVIDSYEPHAESMVENGSWNRGSLKFTFLFFFEKLMSRHAKVIISATAGMKDYARISYGVNLNSFYVKPACVDLKLFNLSKSKNVQLLKSMDLVDKVILVYAGKIGGIYLGREIFDLAKIAHEFYGERFRMLLLSGSGRVEIEKYCLSSGLSPEIVVSKFVSHADIPEYIGLADFALTPIKSVPTKRYCTPIKDGEYWAMGLPILITKDISDDSLIVERENIGAVIETLDKRGYTTALVKIDQLLRSDRIILRTKIRAVAERYRSFKLARQIYSKIYH